MKNNKSKHTPGPWATKDYGLKHKIVGANGHFIGTLRQTPELNKADAALISAAPDLLKSLTYLLDCIERDAGMDDAFWMAHAAIRKATGE